MACSMLWSQDAGQSEWWKIYGDAALDSLESMAMHSNMDLAMAARRVDISRQGVRQAQAAYYPQLGTQLSYSYGKQAAAPEATSVYGGNVNLSWEVDLFGRIRQQVKNARAQVRVSAAEYDGAMLALQAEVASQYFALQVNRMQLQVANEHTVRQKHVLDITEIRYRTGLASRLDVEQARTVYNSTVAQIPLLKATISAAYNALSVLTVKDTRHLVDELYTTPALPGFILPIPENASLELVKRRPDVAQAQAQIESLAASLGIARNQYMPSLSVGASVGTQATSFKQLFGDGSFTYSIAPTLSWTIFDGLGRPAATAQARIALENAGTAYRLTLIEALRDVDNAIQRYKAVLLYIDTLEKVVQSSEETVKLSLDQYKQGLVDFNVVAQSQMSLLSNQNNLIAAKGQALTALVTLYKAMGGAVQ